MISDSGHIALLLHSVREEHSGPYLAALEAKGIPAFCPAPVPTSRSRRSGTSLPASRCFSAGTATGAAGLPVPCLISRTTWTTPSFSSAAALEARILSRRPCNGGPATSRGFRKARRSTYAPLTTSITCSRCLPLDTTKFSETNMFVPLFRATKQALSSEPLLPDSMPANKGLACAR